MRDHGDGKRQRFNRCPRFVLARCASYRVSRQSHSGHCPCGVKVFRDMRITSYGDLAGRRPDSPRPRPFSVQVVQLQTTPRSSDSRCVVPPRFARRTSTLIEPADRSHTTQRDTFRRAISVVTDDRSHAARKKGIECRKWLKRLLPTKPSSTIGVTAIGCSCQLRPRRCSKPGGILGVLTYCRSALTVENVMPAA